MALLLSSCAYYNGMYNANRFAKQAEQSERRGRTAEARERWQRAALHAETVATRHPGSRWADDARLVQGRALVHLENWSDAMVALRRAAELAQEPEQRLEALLLFGRAATMQRRLDEAESALDSALLSEVPARRSAAFLARGRLRLLRRDAAGARADFEASSAPDAPLWRSRAALLAGDPASAATALAALVPQLERFAEREWLPLLDSLGTGGAPEAASAIVDSLVTRPVVARGPRARLLLADGVRLARTGSDSVAGARFRRAAAIIPDSVEARLAALRLVLLDLRAATDDSVVLRAEEELARFAQLGGVLTRESETPLRLLRRWLALADDSGPAADARWYQRAELARDSVGMPAFASRAFLDMAGRFPESPWTPKALIAALALGRTDTAEAAVLLERRYAASPYLIAARGGDSPRYAVLEDSLRRLLAPAADRRPGLAAPGGLTPEELDQPRRARPGAAPTPRPEPQPREPQPREPQPREPQPREPQPRPEPRS